MRFDRVRQGSEPPIYAIAEGRSYRCIQGFPWETWNRLDRTLPMDQAELLAPVAPGKVVAVGLNYRSHAQEMSLDLPSEPLLFLKPPTSVVASGAEICLPPESRQVDFEGELAIVIGRLCRRIAPGEAHTAIAGYTLANDVTARDLQRRDQQWTRAKGFDTFCPLGPGLVTDLDPDSLEFTTRVNGQVRQHGKVKDMIFGPMEIVAFVSRVMTLLPGDVILTGTPPGIGPLNPGDRVQVECSAIGVLENQVSAKGQGSC